MNKYMKYSDQSFVNILEEYAKDRKGELADLISEAAYRLKLKLREEDDLK